MSEWHIVVGKRGATSIEFDGPFFRADPSKTFRQNLHEAIAKIAEEGAPMVRELLPSVTGETRDTVRPVIDRNRASLFSSIRVVSDEKDVPWIRAAWLEGGYRRRKRDSAHARLGLRWTKKGAESSDSVVRMKQAPPRAFARVYRSLNRLRSGIEAELLKGLE